MRSYLYLSTAVAGVVMTAWAGSVWAQSPCLVTENCITLGYTETSCPNGNGLRCPFDELYACLGSSVDCSALGYDKTCSGAGEVGSGPTCNGKYASCTCDASYQYTCTGTGYSGGSGTACGGKYTKCTCQSPYTWTSGACKCPSTYQYTCTGAGEKGSGKVCDGKYTTCTCDKGYEWKNGKCQALNGAKGNLYYCNGKVVGVKDSGMSFYVALQDITPFQEGKVEKTSWSMSQRLCEEYIFCGNLNGKLPSLDQLQTIYNHRVGLDNLFSANGGSELIRDYYWSSSEYAGYRDYYCLSMADGDESRGGWTNWSNYARPILDSY